MRLRLLAGLALSCALAPSVLAQGGGTTPLGHALKPGATTELPASAASVGPNDPVITLSGACKSGASGCVSSVTREQFEKLTNALKPDMTTDQRRGFATQYGKLLAFADQARALGLENDPKFQEVLQFAKNQILVETLNKHYSDEYSHPTDQQIQDYYNQNSKNYVEDTLQRIIIPMEPASGEKKKPTDEEQKAFIEKVRQQWIAGGDPTALQKEAVDRMGLASAPDINLAKRHPGTLPREQESVFALKPGEISQPFVDTGAAYIYKMISVKQVPLDDVKAQIAKTLHDEKMREKIQELNESAKAQLNQAYFGDEKPGPTPPGPEQGATAQQPGGPSSNSNPPTASAPSPK